MDIKIVPRMSNTIKLRPFRKIFPSGLSFTQKPVKLRPTNLFPHIKIVPSITNTHHLFNDSIYDYMIFRLIRFDESD